MLENRPCRNDGLHYDLVDGVPQSVQIDALRQQDLVQSRYLADAPKHKKRFKRQFQFYIKMIVGLKLS